MISHSLTGLNNKYISLSSAEVLGSPRSQCQHGPVLVRTVFLISSHGRGEIVREGNRERERGKRMLSSVSSYKGIDTNTRTPLPRPNYLPKAPPPNHQTGDVGFDAYNLRGHKHSVHSREKINQWGRQAGVGFLEGEGMLSGERRLPRREMGRSRVNPHALQFCLGAGWGMRGPFRGYSSLLSACPHNKLSIPPHVTSASGLYQYLASLQGFPSSSASEESACNAGDLGLIPGLGRSPGGGRGHTLPYACLENPHGQRSLVGFSPQGCKESDMTE